MVNDRRHYADTFWFTLFHEIGHVLNGDLGITFKNEAEDDANLYAQSLPEDADSSFFLCKELIPGYLDDVTGVYQTPQGYYVKDEDVDEFDKEFPPKEKLKLPGQIFG